MTRLPEPGLAAQPGGHQPSPEQTSPEQHGSERILRLVMVGILAWGVVHAVGAWTLNHDARRPLVVLACVAAFLGFWIAMLSSRRRRLASVSGANPLENGGDQCRSRS